MNGEIRMFLLCFLVSCLGGLAQSDSQTSLTICWDSSYSMNDRSLDLELAYLDSLFGSRQFDNVRLLRFANDVQEKNFTITEGDWGGLKSELQIESNDGVTIYKNLNQIPRTAKTLVFTDGAKVFEDDFLSLEQQDILINSSTRANFKNLQLWEFLNRATFVDLTKKAFNENNNDAAPKFKGAVYLDGKPAPNILIESSSGQSIVSKIDGRFVFDGRIGDTLKIKLAENDHQELIVDKADSEMNFFLDSKTVVLEEVTVSEKSLEKDDRVDLGYASIERKKAGFSVYEISEESISNVETSVTDVLKEVPGLIIGQDIAGTKAGGLSTAKIRGKTSINFDAFALVVIDGTPMQRTILNVPSQGNLGSSNADYSFIDTQNIKSIQVLKGLAATNLYGSEGKGGVILITTKTGSVNGVREKPVDQARLTDNIFEGKLVAKKGQLSTPYLKELKKSKNLEAAYLLYLEQRNNYLNDFWYFIDVSDYFRTANAQLADKVLSNVLEMSFGYESDRTLFLKYVELGANDMALNVAQKMIKDHPNKIQAYLDIATAYRNSGNYQAAFELLNSIVNGTLDAKMNFGHLRKVADAELRNLMNQHPEKLSLSNSNVNNANNLTYNARLRFDWASPQDAFILKFVNPEERFFDWEHTSISDRKRITDEIEHGFATEQFEIVGDISKGKWGIYITNLAEPSAKVPFWVKCTVDYNFGKPNQYSEEKLIRLDPSENEEQLFFKFSIY